MVRPHVCIEDQPGPGIATLGVLAGGGSLMWADQTQRQDGYVITRTAVFSTGGYALASGPITLLGGWELLEPVIGSAQIRVTPTGRSAPVFPGVGPRPA